jgi:hypothetical protein
MRRVGTPRLLVSELLATSAVNLPYAWGRINYYSIRWPHDKNGFVSEVTCTQSHTQPFVSALGHGACLSTSSPRPHRDPTVLSDGDGT